MPTVRMVALAMASFAACGQTPAPEARTVRISGRVVDEVGCPIPYEAVGLRLPQTFDSLARVPTDSEGRFTFPAVQPMKYELVVRLPYHRPVCEPLDARQGNDAPQVKLEALLEAFPAALALLHATVGVVRIWFIHHGMSLSKRKPIGIDP